MQHHGPIVLVSVDEAGQKFLENDFAVVGVKENMESASLRMNC